MKNVSVVIAAYNVEKYIEETINSVLNQTWTNIEIIVVNDGSKDNTFKILNHYRDKINIIDQENMGQSGATNSALRVAKGEYICLHDADDIMMNEKIEKQVKFLENKPDYGLVFTNGCHIDENGLVIKETFYTNPPPQGYIFRELFCNNTVAGATSMVTREAFQRTGLLDTQNRMQDYPFVLRIAYYYKIGYIDELLYAYRRHNTNISSNSYYAVLGDLLTIEDIIDKYSDVEIILGKKVLADRMSELYYRAARVESTYGNNLRMANRYYIKSLQYKLSIKALCLYIMSKCHIMGK